MIKFKELIKYVKVKKNTPIKVVWEFEGNQEDIEHIQTDCGCSSAIKEDNQIMVIYNHSTGNIAKRHVTLYLKDKEPLKIKINDVEVVNPLKKQIVLTLSGVLSD